MKYSELEKIIKEAGCYILKQGGNHAIWYSPITGKKFPVGRHRTEDVPNGTLNSIKKMAGIK